jgi:hypothetical protein
MTTTFPILDLAIGLIFIYFLFSIVLSSFTEVILSTFKIRALSLQKWLRDVLPNAVATFNNTGKIVLVKATDDNGNVVKVKTTENGIEKESDKLITVMKPLGEAIMDHFAVKGTTADGKSPSYIDAKNFAAALIDKMTLDPAAPNKVVSTMKEMIEKLECAPLPVDLRRVFIGYAQEVSQIASADINKGVGELQLFSKRIETWFDSSMDRLEGNTKRIASWITLAASIVIVVAMNIDTISIAQYLYKNPTVASALADQAIKTANDPKIKDRVKKLEEAQSNAAKKGDSKDSAAIQEVLDNIKTTQDDYLTATKTMLDSKIPFGWDSSSTSETKNGEDKTKSSVSKSGMSFCEFIGFEDGQKSLLKLLGLLITALAMTLGAPFWFDILSKLASLRGTGAKPKTTEEKEKAAKPTA